MAKLKNSKRSQRKASGDNGCGLANLGNTCFMNSALQCLTHMPDLRDYFLQDWHVREINSNNPLGHGGRIAKSFGDVMKSVWNEGVSSFSPKQFKQVMGQEHHQFHGFSQQDSQEFMTILLDGIHEDLNRVLVKPYMAIGDNNDKSDEELARESWKYFCSRNQSVIVDLFFGMIRSTVTCPDCNHVSVTFDPVNQLSCPLPDPNDRYIQFYFMKNTCARPRKTRLAANCDATIGEFLDIVSAYVDVPQSHLAMFEIHRSGYVKAVLPNDQLLSDVKEQENVKLFVYAFSHKFSSASRRFSADSFTVVSKKSGKGRTRQIAAERAAQEEEDSDDDWIYAIVYICIESSDESLPSNERRVEAPDVSPEIVIRNSIVAEVSDGLTRVDNLPEKTPNAALTFNCATTLDDAVDAEKTKMNAVDETTVSASEHPDAGTWEDLLAESAPVKTVEVIKPAPVCDSTKSASSAAGSKHNTLMKPSTIPFIVRVPRDGMPTAELYEVLRACMRRFYVDTAKGSTPHAVKDADLSSDDDSGLSDTGTNTDHVIENDSQRATPSPVTTHLSVDNEEALSSTLPDSHVDSCIPDLSLTLPAVDYPFCVAHLGSNNVNDVTQKVLPPRSALRRRMAASSESSLSVPSTTESEHADGSDVDEGEIILFDIPSSNDTADSATKGSTEINHRQGGPKSSCNHKQSKKSKKHERLVQRRKQTTTAPATKSSAANVTGADNFVYLCINVQKGYAESAHLFDQAEFGRFDTDPTATLSVDKASAGVPNFVDINDCIRTFLKPERLSEREMWHCKVCSEPKRAEKKLDLWYLPKYLIIHLKRFNYSRWSHDKLRQRVRINEFIDMSQYVKNRTKSDEPLIYDFIAVSNHSGGLGAGHYWAHAQDRDGRWVELNDSHVGPSSYADASGDDVGDETCYMVFFKLRQFHYELEKLPSKAVAAPTGEKLDAHFHPVATCSDDDVVVIETGTGKAANKKKVAKKT